MAGEVFNLLCEASLDTRWGSVKKGMRAKGGGMNQKSLQSSSRASSGSSLIHFFARLFASRQRGGACCRTLAHGARAPFLKLRGNGHTLKRILPHGLRTRLGAVRRRVRALRFRTEGQKRRLLEDAGLDAAAARELLRAVESRISPRDTMYSGDGAHYFKVGLSAMRAIEEARENANLSSVRNVLDLPCGHGRVLRFLVERFAEARFTACDLDRDGVDFCARTFGATPVYSDPDLDVLSFEARFDLIWCGSLITHLDEHATRALFRLFARHLAPGGLLVFSAHGDFVAGRMPRGEFDYMLTAAQIEMLTTRYAQTGFAYTDYAGQGGYGVALTAPAWIRAQVREMGGLREVYFKERVWDEHHDVFGYVRED
jgi:SAM-dependent methyltransferase